MIISFDLDDTLIPGTKKFPTEKQTGLQRLLGLEKIRAGTIELFKTLHEKGHVIYIYTTSFRSSTRIKLTFYAYGIPIDGAINQQKHDRTLLENKTRTSKHPPSFGIHVHVDDSPGVKIEGKRFDFPTIIIGENDTNWGQKILDWVKTV
jgi:hypothetical protein